MKKFIFYKNQTSCRTAATKNNVAVWQLSGLQDESEIT